MTSIFPGLRKEFLNRLAFELNKTDYIRKGQDFYKKRVYGNNQIRVTFVSYPKVCFEVELFIGVRHDIIEELTVQYLPNLPKEMHRSITTVGNRLDNIQKDYTRYKWPIASENDIEPELRAILTVIEEIADPYFERFSSLEEVFKVISADDRELRRFTMWFPQTAAIRGAIVAYMLGWRKEYDQFVAKSENSLAKWAPVNPNVADAEIQFKLLIENIDKKWKQRNDFVSQLSSE